MSKLWRGRRLSLGKIRKFLALFIGLFCAISVVLYTSRLPPTRDDLKIEQQLSSPRTYRCDEVFPIVRSARTIELGSVPSQNRIPPGTSNVTTYMLSSPRNVAPFREYFFDYNPSIIRIPPDQLPKFSGAVYLASFRVSNLNYCFRPEDRQRMVNYTAIKAKDWLGLALLTDDLDIIADVVVDLQAVVRGAQDFRLFLLDAMDSTTNAGQMYISSNDVLVPLRLSVEETQKPTFTRVPSVFGNSFGVYIAETTLCAPCGKPRMCGKNFHFFTSQQQIWAEVWPSAPHLVRSVASPCRRRIEPNQTFSTENSPKRSFYNKELALLDQVSDSTMMRKAKAPSWLTRGRGSACCISIRHPTTGQSLWMGISHSKTLGNQGLQPNHYLSSLYAFDSQPPFSLVAQSGYFCLPFSSNQPNDGTTMADLTRWRVLKFGDKLEYTSCPRIHFVSGVTLSATDPGTVIIAYGVNDCVSRFIQVRLSDMVDMLFDGLP